MEYLKVQDSVGRLHALKFYCATVGPHGPAWWRGFRFHGPAGGAGKHEVMGVLGPLLARPRLTEPAGGPWWSRRFA